ncbi:MAG TPA: hypothetical protein VEI97_15405, partial [bacterium]|nr:hypothetical protein [bacterium]
LQMRGEGERTNLHPAEMEEEPRVLALPGAEELMAAFFVSELPGDLRGHLALGEKLLALLGQVEAPYITAAVHQLRAQLYLQLDGGQEASPDYDAAIDATRAAADAFKGTPYTGDRASLLFDLGELLHHDKGPDRGQHLEEAIAVLQEAASIFTREAKADRWAYLQLSLATAYRDRQTGDGQENLQAARRHLEEALDTFIDLPEESFDTRIVAVAAWNRAMLLHEMLQAGLPGVTEQEWRVADAFARQYPNPWLEAMGEG